LVVTLIRQPVAATEVEHYSDDQIAAWLHADALLPEEREKILRASGVGPFSAGRAKLVSNELIDRLRDQNGI